MTCILKGCIEERHFIFLQSGRMYTCVLLLYTCLSMRGHVWKTRLWAGGIASWHEFLGRYFYSHQLLEGHVSTQMRCMLGFNHHHSWVMLHLPLCDFSASYSLHTQLLVLLFFNRLSHSKVHFPFATMSFISDFWVWVEAIMRVVGMGSHSNRRLLIGGDRSQSFRQ